MPRRRQQTPRKAKPMRVRKDDTVIVTSGKDRGKTGKVLRTEPGKQRVYVEGLNIVKRHTRPRSIRDTQKGEAGGIIEQEAPIHVSNVMVVDPQDSQRRPDVSLHLPPLCRRSRSTVRFARQRERLA